MTYQVYSLEPLGAAPAIGSPGDPIAAYGNQAAAAILAAVHGASPSARAHALEQALSAIDPSLPGRVREREHRYASKGAPREHALRRALSTSLSDGVVSEFSRRGASPAGRIGLGVDRIMFASTTIVTREPPPRKDGSGSGTKADPFHFNMMSGTTKLTRRTWHTSRGRELMATPALKAAYKKVVATATKRWKELLARTDASSRFRMTMWMTRAKKLESGSFPFSTFKNVDDGDKKYGVYYDAKGTGSVTIKAVPPSSSVWSQLKGVIADIGYGLTWPLRKVATEAGKAAAKAGDAVADLTCKLANNPAAPAAAMGAGGGPAGAAGVQIAKSLCNPQETTPPPLPPPPPSSQSWVVPAVLAAGALGAFFIITRKR